MLLSHCCQLAQYRGYLKQAGRSKAVKGRREKQRAAEGSRGRQRETDVSRLEPREAKVSKRGQREAEGEHSAAGVSRGKQRERKQRDGK